jgi:hypothetical protein
MDEKFKPAKRVAGQRQDVWSIVNEAAAASPVQPIGEWNIPIALQTSDMGSEHGSRLFVSMQPRRE